LSAFASEATTGAGASFQCPYKSAPTKVTSASIGLIEPIIGYRYCHIRKSKTVI